MGRGEQKYHHDGEEGMCCGATEHLTESFSLPSKNHCWVCASREDGFVEEPDALTKAQVTLEDADMLGSARHILQFASNVQKRMNLIMWVVVVLLAGSTFVEASGSQSMDAAQTVRIVATALAALSSMAFLIVGNAVYLGSKGDDHKNPSLFDEAKLASLDIKEGSTGAEKLAKTLSKAIQIKTVSYEPDNLEGLETDFSQFLALHKLLQDSFPLVHESPHIERTVINKYSLLYEWKGKSQELPPIMLCAHLDVVPTPNAASWSIPDPFSGEIDDNGVIWGRGAIDNKHNVIAQMQAVESLLQAGVTQPERTVFLAMGHDEELGGVDGAKYISKEVKRRLDARNQSLAFLLDEGPFLIKNVLPGLNQPVALIGTSEKGSVNVKLSVSTNPPGHSSMPPVQESNIGILSSAIKRLEARPFPASGLNFMIDNWQLMGRELPFGLRALFANGWLFKPLLRRVLLAKSATAASVRTTTAVTIVRAGTKINVLPGEVNAYINHRIHPVDKSHEYVLDYDRKVINDPRVKVSVYESEPVWEPSPITPADSPQYRVLASVVHRIFNAPSVPSIMVGNTDTRHYWTLHEEGKTFIFRFTPIVFECLEDTRMFHGINERVTTKNLVKLHNFYACLIHSASQVDNPSN
mmetsp:Transcript_12388/g.24088  ORF Transcript_12388/g.24088 Transcript_12388/m.24088 type:complete len:638 (+) Transcript_12388:767-2680(+)|eukprot:CAMPEP_0171496886 /NCGR_PEP_ID=MMETSP0958-20121227/6954_1 /TAXON_ID=87120 /ORGANISM="Aurantiochytrium limacinum, Strain ATCCMYA-1381" /LENGTH=637 /DNA_ID=CAMNT_0012031045 /DNA_START=363 /DNA_END=2276 /DNA_ORIENTATION=+